MYIGLGFTKIEVRSIIDDIRIVIRMPIIGTVIKGILKLDVRNVVQISEMFS